MNVKTNMALKKLVQNHFELVGSFNGIEKRYYYCELLTTADQKGITVKDYLFELLGYTNTSFATASELFDIRMALTRQDTEALESLLGNSSIEAAECLLRDNGVLPVVVSNGPVKIQKHSSYVRMLSDYYKSTPEFYVPYDDIGLVPMDYLIAMWRQKPGAAKTKANAIYESLSLSNALVRVQYAYGCSPAVNCGVFTTDIELTEKEIQQLQVSALTEAISPSVGLQSKIVSKFTKLITIAEDDVATYLSLLEFAIANDTTYAKMLNRIGLKVPDYSNIYRSLGVVPVCIGDAIKMFYKEGCSFINTNEFDSFCIHAVGLKKMGVF